MKYLIYTLLSLSLLGCATSSKDIIIRAKPLERSTPKYPVSADTQGITGYVILSFDVNKKGKPENIKVQNAYPKPIFNEVTKKALSTWVYSPKTVNGFPEVQKGLMVRLDFDINPPKIENITKNLKLPELRSMESLVNANKPLKQDK